MTSRSKWTKEEVDNLVDVASKNLKSSKDVWISLEKFYNGSVPRTPKAISDKAYETVHVLYGGKRTSRNIELMGQLSKLANLVKDIKVAKPEAKPEREIKINELETKLLLLTDSLRDLHKTMEEGFAQLQNSINANSRASHELLQVLRRALVKE